MRFARTIGIAAVCVAAVSLAVAARPSPTERYEREMDRSVRPGEDFYRFANGGWLRSTTVPEAGSYGTSALLTALTGQRVSDLIHEAATLRGAKGSIAQKVGDYYASFA